MVDVTTAVDVTWARRRLVTECPAARSEQEARVGRQATGRQAGKQAGGEAAAAGWREAAVVGWEAGKEDEETGTAFITRRMQLPAR